MYPDGCTMEEFKQLQIPDAYCGAKMEEAKCQPELISGSYLLS